MGNSNNAGRLALVAAGALAAGVIGAKGSQAQQRTTALRVPASVLVEASPSPSPSPTPSPTSEPSPRPVRPVLLRPVFARPAPNPTPAPAPTTPPVRAANPVVRPAVLRPVEREPVVRRTEIVPPSRVTDRTPAGTLTLRSAQPNSAIMRNLHVVRTYSPAQLRTRPTVVLGGSQISLAPVLSNPKSLPQIASRLRAAPDAEVLADSTTVTEIDQGLVVHSFMTYRVRPGTCTTAARRSTLARSGVSCAGYLPASARAAAFANPGDPHYVADPQKRSAALAMANEQASVAEADLNQAVGDLRTQLADPAQRGQFDAQLGPGEASRLAAMSDDELKAEIVNSGETSLEQTFFVPNLSRVSPAFRTKFALAAKPAPAPPEAVKPDIDVSAPIDEHIYLTGFTLGKDYEWNQRIEKTIKRCLVGCSKTYYAEVSAGFNYGFGLRFPLKVGGTYTYHRDGSGGNEKASLTTTFVPVNGTAKQYQEAGLDPAKVFEGKEFVAQFGGHAGAAHDLPLIPSGSINVAIEYDFTKELEGDFYDGQFTPPTPGSGTGPSMDKFFTDVDLAGGALNFGIVGAKIFPAAKVTLLSDSLTFTVHDFQSNQDIVVDHSGQTIPLGVRPQNHASHFAIGDPKYSLALNITPGIDARLFVDIAVWSHNWDFPVWFPQMAIKIPPDGATFGCHAGTICSRGYEYTPAGHQEVSVSEAALDSELGKWGDGFDGRWMSECADETCRFGIKFIRQGYIYGVRHKQDANPALTIQSPEVANYLKGAEGEAKTMVNEAQARQTTNAAKSFGTFWIAWWSKQCSDKICMDKVKGIAFFAQLEAVSLQKQHEDWSTNQVIGIVGKKFAPKYEYEVQQSKDRVAAEEAAQAARLAKRLKPVPLKFRGRN